MNVHYHVAIPDGVFTFTFSEDDAPATFHRLPAPDSTDLQEIASDVAIRTLAWLRRRELLRDEPDERDSTEQRDRSALSACLEGSLGLGELTALPKRNEAESDDATLPVPSKSARRGGTDRGFDLTSMPWLVPAAAGYVSSRSFSRATSRDAFWTASASKAQRLRSPARVRSTSLMTRHPPTGDAFGREGRGRR